VVLERARAAAATASLDRRWFLRAVVAAMAAPGFVETARAAARLDVLRHDRARVIRLARKYLREPPVTLTAFAAARSPGGRRDYYSEGDYWWPDPANPGGPYIRRDGFSNPDKFVAHREALIRLSLIVPGLVAGWRATRDSKFALHAAKHLDAWFVDPVTSMIPALPHAQAIIGVNTGRGIGIIDTLHLVEVARAAMTLNSEGPHLLQQGRAIRDWFAAYLKWLATSPNGVEERDEKNNHGSCWVLQAAQFALLTGNRETIDWCRDRFKTRLIPEQIAPDGSQPLELRRTKPYAYTLFNLDVLATVAHILTRPEDNLWTFETSDGRSLAKALAFVVPFIADKLQWPYPPDVEAFEGFPARHPSVLFGGLALNRADYVSLWQRLGPDPDIPEVIRNFPIRQPVLWVR
jgi:hypothetical protein